jgi:hypothetical protein
MSEFKIIKHSRLKDASPDSKVEEGDMILVGFSYKSAKFQLLREYLIPWVYIDYLCQ